jgi:hypothetical protein
MWVKLRNEWMNAENLGICSSLGIELFLTNHKDSIVPMSKLRNVWGSAISNNSNNSNITLFTNELFGKDSVSNIDEHGELQVFEMDNSKGYFAGTNRYDFMRFSEKISKGNQQYIRGLKLIPYLNQFTDTAVKVKLCVWRGLARPDSLVYSELVSLANLTANYCNVIMFKRKVKTDSVCFIGYEILDPYSTDTLALFMGTPKPKTDPEHSFFSAEGSWVNFNLCEIRSSLAVSAHTCYTKYFFEKDSLSYRYKTTGRVTKKKVTSKRISLFPNPTGGAYMYISMGTHFTRDIHVEICDFAGRVISKQTPELIAANVARISVSEIPRGIYLVKTMIQDQYFQPLKIIKK